LPGKNPARRRRLVEAILAAGRESSTATVLFHNAIAAQTGLAATETKTLDVLLRHGALSAGELGKHTGLASASVTSLIDRLEAKGLVRRVRDGKDRRRVMVQPDASVLARLEPSFAAVGPAFAALLESYNDPQLETILDYMRRASELARSMTARLAKKRGS
jgi:DNA-binding MarR family transcriptional regulator